MPTEPTPRTSPVLRNGSTFYGGRYVVKKPLASGGMGRIFLAEDRTLGREVAIKIIRDEYADDPSFVERFWREARAAAAIGHPNIVQVFEIGQIEGGLPFIVMEALEGRDLRQELLASTRLPFRRAVEIAGQVLFALAAAHRAGIVHRDLKPANVFIARRKVSSLSELDSSADAATVKLLDFGISRFLQARKIPHRELTSQGDLLGTIKYMAPEQLDSSRDVDGRVDLYSLGVILYECVTGQSPFGDMDGAFAVMKRAFQRPIQPAHELVPDIPEGFSFVLERALAQHRLDRFPDATTFVEALRPFHNADDEETHRVWLHPLDETGSDGTDAVDATEAPTAVRDTMAVTQSSHLYGFDGAPTQIIPPRRLDLDVSDSDETLETLVAPMVETPTTDFDGQGLVAPELPIGAPLLSSEGPETQPLHREAAGQNDASVVRARPAPNQSRRAFVAAALLVLVLVIIAGVWIARWEPDEPPEVASAESSRTNPTPSPAARVGALKVAEHGVTTSTEVAPTESSPDSGDDERGSSPLPAVTKALELFDHGDYEGCVDVLADLPPEPEVNTLMRRCETANRQVQAASKRPANGGEHRVHPRRLSKRGRPPGGEVPSPVRTDEQAPSAEGEGEGEGPFARDAPW